MKSLKALMIAMALLACGTIVRAGGETEPVTADCALSVKLATRLNDLDLHCKTYVELTNEGRRVSGSINDRESSPGCPIDYLTLDEQEDSKVFRFSVTPEMFCYTTYRWVLSFEQITGIPTPLAERRLMVPSPPPPPSPRASTRNSAVRAYEERPAFSLGRRGQRLLVPDHISPTP